MLIYLLKMVPSKDPLPIKLFLGYKAYPTETSHVAMTEMPHQGNTEGNTSFCSVVETVFFISNALMHDLSTFVFV